MADDDTTKDELQEELRRRDLPVSGTKDELEERLREEGEDEPKKKASKKAASKKTAKKASKKTAKKQGASKKAAKKSTSKKATSKKATKKQGGATQATSKKASKKQTSEKQTSEKQTSKKQGTARMQSTSSQQDTSDRQRDGEDRREGSSGPPKAGEVARLAARQLGGLTRHQIEGISGIAREEDGWRVEVEVVEVHRVPPTTDVLGIYAVYVDRDGDLVSYERVERYVRGQASRGEG